MRTSQIGIPERWLTVVMSAVFVVCWSSGFIGAKLGAAEASVLTILMWRFLVIAIVLGGVIGVMWRRQQVPSMTRGQFGLQLVIGVLSQCGYTVTVYWAISLGVSTGTTALIDGVQPLVVAALAGPLLGAVTHGKQWLGLAVGAAGVVLVTWSDASSSAGAPWWAYLVPLLGMASLVVATFLERLVTDAPPPTVILTIHCGASAVIFTAASVAAGVAVPPAAGAFWLSIAWLTVLSTLGGYGLYWVLLRRSGVTSVNSLMFLMPPVTAVWGTAMYGEPFTWATALGLAMACGATWVVNREAAPPDAAPSISKERVVAAP
ncbi:DMT family transporter [Gordonia sp. zg691]|uniref:DMT family transporter n=1 Tax=Gordonia jinghuaiqii TaxID=2758710 RepID=UPI001662859E|nr:DMT family transporter [Gordonia jinghuaiqii]MBD0863153.1 DMT family transporter [Gordonia jinghuaiqii]